MKSRLAFIAVLAMGILMSGTGATLAISGIAGSGNAGVAQYDEDEPDTEVLEEVDTGTPPVETVEQVSVQSDEGSLPFTGFVVIPLLVGGVALIGGGAAMRRRTKGGDIS